MLVHPDHFCISAAGVWLSGNCCCCASITKKALDHSLDHKWYKTWMQPPCYPLVSKIDCFHHRHLVFWNGMWPTSGWIWLWKRKPVKVATLEDPPDFYFPKWTPGFIQCNLKLVIESVKLSGKHSQSSQRKAAEGHFPTDVHQWICPINK